MPRLLSIAYTSRLQTSIIQRDCGQRVETHPLIIGFTGQHFNPSAGRMVQKTTFEPEEIEPLCELFAFSLFECGLEIPESMRQLLDQARKKRPHRIIEK